MRYVYLQSMKYDINTYKGIHPGKLIERSLKKLGISQREFARTIGEHSQTINAIITGRRALTVKLALAIEHELGFDEGFLLALQAYYDIAQYKHKEASASITGKPNIRRILFWDTDFDKIDWGRYRNAVIQRVMERGNESEKAEVIRFYKLESTNLKQFQPTNTYRIRASK